MTSPSLIGPIANKNISSKRKTSLIILELSEVLFLLTSCVATLNCHNHRITKKLLQNIGIGSTTPSDSNFSNNQWAYNSIHAGEAWDISVGSKDVDVAILDTGTYSSHNDLTQNIGPYFDTVYYYDYQNGIFSLSDPDGHGTNVAGVIASKGNNSIGACGVCWNSSLLPFKIYDFPIDGYMTANISYMISAIEFATLYDIPIINYSSRCLGTIDNTFENTIRNYPGLFVCCAGNDCADIDTSWQVDSYPSECSNMDNLISVGALDSSGHIKSNSNYGSLSVDLFAPGEGIYTTTNSQNSYTSSFSDTSCATAFVSGAAALLKSINPDLTTSQLKSAILDNVDAVDELAGKCTTGGKLNVYKAALSIIPELSSNVSRSVDSQSYNWVKIIVNDPATYGFTLTGAPNLELRLSNGVESYYVPMETSTIETGYTSISFNYLFGTPGTYYLRVKNNLAYKTNYTLSKSLVSLHNHSFTGNLIYVDGQYHGRTCTCGVVGNLTMHMPKANDPNICRFCNGIIGS